MIYCDNAATTFPKPASVARAMSEHLAHEAVNPGRAGFDLALQAAAAIDALRRDLGQFFNNPAADPDRTIFAANATTALNLAIGGLCRDGDHVVAEATAHNSVLRPLHMLHRQGRITFDLAPCDGSGFVDPADVERLINPATRLVILNHAGNVTGAVQDVRQVGRICRDRDALLLLDTAQSAGVLEVDMARDNIDAVAFTGHKGLMGPTGTGGLVLGPRAEPESILWGGTGVRSAQLTQPSRLPYRLEAGTLNAVGLAGLAAGLAWVRAEGPARLAAREAELATEFAALCRGIPGLNVLGHDPHSTRRHLAVVSLTVPGMDPEKIGILLDVQWGIAVRTGLHCAPLVHQALGTAPSGTVRFGFGPFNQKDQLPRLREALTAVVRGS